MSTVVAALVAVAAVVGVPGLLVGTALGLRGWHLLGSAGALGFGLLATLATLCSLVGVSWSVTTVAVVTALVAVVAATVRLVLPWRRRRAAATGRAPDPVAEAEAEAGSDAGARAGADAGPQDAAQDRSDPSGPASPRGWSAAASLAVGAAVVAAGGYGAWIVESASRHLTGVNQSWDAIFHAGAIRQIAVTADGDSSRLNIIGSQYANKHFFYPDAVHEVGALLVRLGFGTVTTYNALTAVAAGLLALGVVAYVRVKDGSPATAVGAALAVGVIGAPVYDLVLAGPLLPFSLGLGLLPAFVGLVVRLVETPDLRRAAAVVIAAIALPLVHPQVALVAVVWIVVEVVVGALQRRVRWRAIAWLAAAGVVTALVNVSAARGLTTAAGSAQTLFRPRTDTPGEALWHVVGLHTFFRTPQYWLAGLSAIGAVVTLVRRRWLPVLVTTVAFGGVYVLATSVSGWSHRLTSLFWDDPYRLAAVYAVGATVLVGLAVGTLAELAAAAARRLTHAGTRLTAAAAALATAAVVLVVGLVTRGDHDQLRYWVGEAYNDGPTFTLAEAAGARQLAGMVHGGTVMNDPGDGSAWAWAADGVPVVFRSPLTPPFDPKTLGADATLLLDHFDDMDTDPAVREAARRLDVRWLVLDDGFVQPWLQRAPGLRDLERVDALHLAYTNGAVTIWRVDLGGAPGS